MIEVQARLCRFAIDASGGDVLYTRGDRLTRIKNVILGADGPAEVVFLANGKDVGQVLRVSPKRSLILQSEDLSGWPVFGGSVTLRCEQCGAEKHRVQGAILFAEEARV